MNKETVTLGDKSYVLTEQPVRPGAAFRDALKIHFGSLLDVIEQAPDMDLDDPSTIKTILQNIGGTVLDSTVLMTEMLVLFSPELKKDEEYIWDNAVGSQIIDAFIVCLMLTFPFWESQRLRILYTTLQSVGLTQRLMKTNSASVNGASGAMSLIREASNSSTQVTSGEGSGKPN